MNNSDLQGFFRSPVGRTPWSARVPQDPLSRSKLTPAHQIYSLAISRLS